MTNSIEFGVNIKKGFLGAAAERSVKMKNCIDPQAFEKSLEKVFGDPKY